MSEFFRIPVNPNLHACGMTTLARLAHHAENTGDDILLIQVAEEADGRPVIEQDLYRLEYLRLHREHPGECRDAIVRALGGLPG